MSVLENSQLYLFRKYRNSTNDERDMVFHMPSYSLGSDLQLSKIKCIPGPRP